MGLRNKKTGEIADRAVITVAPYNSGVRGCRAKTYRSVDELNEEWEDYKPKETPIEVKKIQKIIRAWAEVNGVKELKYIADENSLQDIFRNSISFNRVLDLKDGEQYTIDELCGEEEE